MQLNFKIPTIVRYLIIAVAAYVIDMGGFIVLLFLNVPPILANILVKIGAAIFGFYGHRYFTYQIKHSNNILAHAIKYFGLVLVYTPVSSVCLAIMIKIIADPVVAKFICDVVLFVVVYWVTSKFTFLQQDVQQTVADK
jgi:putative flippase GtrA